MASTSITITAIDAVQVNVNNQSIVRIRTDAGITGYGEAGGRGPMVRGNLEYLRPFLLGENPLEIRKLFDRMIGLQHPNRPHVPTVSGIDIALWDIAGKHASLPVSRLLRGRHRNEIPMYANSRGPGDWRDRGSVAEWAARIKEHPAGFKAWKMSFVPLYGSVIPAGNRPRQERAMTLRPSEIRGIARYYETVREALDSSFDLMIHCHNEYDLPSMLMLAKALEPVAPMWLEDPLPIPYFDGWKQLTSRSSVPILTGEKLELASEFLPFFANQAVDIVQPDLVYAGGFTGCWQIAELADLYSVPLTMHNVGTVVHNVANAHFAAATRNFVMSETRMGNNRPVLEELVEEEIVIRDGLLPVPDGPGLGITVSEEALKANRADGEPWWDE